MFGFPFITSIIVMMLLATLFSIIVNKGFNGTSYNGTGGGNHCDHSGNWSNKAPCCHG